MTNSRSSLLIISIVIPYFISHNKGFKCMEKVRVKCFTGLIYLKFSVDDGPNLITVIKIDVSSTFYWKYMPRWVDPSYFLRLLCHHCIDSLQLYLDRYESESSLKSRAFTTMTKFQTCLCLNVIKIKTDVYFILLNIFKPNRYSLIV